MPPPWRNNLGNVFISDKDDPERHAKVSSLGQVYVTGAPSSDVTIGLLKHYRSCDATNNAVNVKNGPGKVYAIRAINVGATLVYVKTYNLSAAPNPAAATVFDCFPVPADSGSLGAGFIQEWDGGVIYDTGIGFAVVTGFSDTDNTAIAANQVKLTVYYV